MKTIHFAIILLCISFTAQSQEMVHYQGFFNTGLSWSSTKWPFEEDKWEITNKPSFIPLTSIGFNIGSRLNKEFSIEL